jgi:hypothetical protein
MGNNKKGLAPMLLLLLLAIIAKFLLIRFAVLGEFV